jgi:hypothetical protein
MPTHACSTVITVARVTTSRGLHDRHEDAGAPGLDAIERMYEEAKACLAEATGWPAPDTTDLWPETEAIDVRALKAPAAARMAVPAAHPTPSPGGAEASACQLETDHLAGRMAL